MPRLLPGVSSQIMNCTPGATGVWPAPVPGATGMWPAPGTVAPCWLHPTASSQLIRGRSGSAERTKASHKHRKRPSNKVTALEGGGCGWGPSAGFPTGNRPADGVPAGCMTPETRSRGTPEPRAGWRPPRSLLSPHAQETGSPGSRPTGRLQRTPRRPACWWGWWERAGHRGHPPPDKHSDRPCTEAWHSQEKPQGRQSQEQPNGGGTDTRHLPGRTRRTGRRVACRMRRHCLSGDTRSRGRETPRPLSCERTWDRHGLMLHTRAAHTPGVGMHPGSRSARLRPWGARSGFALGVWGSRGEGPRTQQVDTGGWKSKGQLGAAGERGRGRG